MNTSSRHVGRCQIFSVLALPVELHIKATPTYSAIGILTRELRDCLFLSCRLRLWLEPLHVVVSEVFAARRRSDSARQPPHGVPSLLPVSSLPPDDHTAVLPDEGRSLQVQPGVRLHRTDLHHHYPEPAPFNQVTDGTASCIILM